jgi:hypothetical protein
MVYGPHMFWWVNKTLAKLHAKYIQQFQRWAACTWTKSEIQAAQRQTIRIRRTGSSFCKILSLLVTNPAQDQKSDKITPLYRIWAPNKMIVLQMSMPSKIAVRVHGLTPFFWFLAIRV